MAQLAPLTWKEAKARAQQRGCSSTCVCRECCLDEAAQSLGPVPMASKTPRTGGSRPVAQAPAKRRPWGWREASEKQVDLIGKLFNEREWDSPLIAQALALETYEDDFGGREASALIDLLFKLPKAGTRARKAQQEAISQRLDEELEEGALYALGEGDATEIYRVQRSKTSKKLYALLVLEGGGTDYAPGVVTKLDPNRKLTLDEAQAWGRRTGTCCNCYAKLTNPVSVERGLGPVCAGRI